jgi:hypothetical protein
MSETVLPDFEMSKPSKMARLRSTATGVGFFVIPTAFVAVVTVAGYKTSLNNLEAAKLAFETAKLNAQA